MLAVKLSFVLALPSDPEANRIILRVVMVGSVIILVSAGALILFFRSFDERRQSASNFKLAWMLAIAMAVVVTFCMVLLRLSYSTS